MTLKTVRITDSKDYTDDTDHASPRVSSSVESVHPCQSVIQTPTTTPYKQTEVGLIPEEWEVKAIKEFATVKGGKRLPLGKSLIDKETPHPYVRVTDMRPGGVVLDDIKYVPEDVFPAIKSYRISSKDIFISVAGTLGIVGKVPPRLDGANLTENADKITDISCDQGFLLYNLMSERIQGIIESEKTVGAQPKLALAWIENFRIALPPTLPEQRAIAAALSDVDALIAALDRLIAKKRDLKQAAMQQLLIGRTRLPGFNGEWQVKRLGDVFQFLNTANNPRSELSDTGEVSYIHYGDIHTLPSAFLDCSKAALPLIAKSKVANIPLVENGDLVMVDTSEDYAGTGKSVEIQNTNGREIVAGLHTLLLRGDKALVADGFKGYLQVFASVRTALIRLATGISVYGVSKTNVRSIEVALPHIDEQTTIAAILSDMDAEIAALERRLAKTRALKQGMMQELLTGRVRLLEKAA